MGWVKLSQRGLGDPLAIRTRANVRALVGSQGIGQSGCVLGIPIKDMNSRLRNCSPKAAHESLGWRQILGQSELRGVCPGSWKWFPRSEHQAPGEANFEVSNLWIWWVKCLKLTCVKTQSRRNSILNFWTLPREGEEENVAYLQKLKNEKLNV